MTPALVLTLAKKYLQDLTAMGVEPLRGDTTKYARDLPLKSRDSHVAWMCEQIVKLLTNDPTDTDILKAHRWLSFIQGTMYEHNFYTIDQLRSHNTEAHEIP